MVISIYSSLKALEDPHAPETGPAGDVPDMAVLFELVGLDVVARCQAATVAVGIIVVHYLCSERLKCRTLFGREKRAVQRERCGPLSVTASFVLRIPPMSSQWKSVAFSAVHHACQIT